MDRTTLVSTLKAFQYHLYTIWLFPYQQLYDVVIPGTMFGVCGALSGEALGFPEDRHPSSIIAYLSSETMYRAGLSSLWLWLISLQFCLHNQRQLDSIAEDRINKPWRPLAAGRLSVKNADRILLAVYWLALISSYSLGVSKHFALFTSLNIWNNDFGGGEHGGFIRNALCGAGLMSLFSGSLRIAVGPKGQLTNQAWTWVVMLALVILTTIHAQDFRDVRGDAARGRRTIVTYIGDTGARWVLVCGTMFWSIFLPIWFDVSWLYSLVPRMVGLAVIVLTVVGLNKGNVRLDRILYRVWALWLVSFCPIPFFKACHLARLGMAF